MNTSKENKNSELENKKCRVVILSEVKDLLFLLHITTNVGAPSLSRPL